MKILRKISFLLLIVVMFIFTFKTLSSGNISSAEENEIKTSASIEVVNGNSNAGSLSISLYDSNGKEANEYNEDENHKILIPRVLNGYKITVNAKLNEGYDVFTWASFNDSTYTPVKNASGDLYKSLTLNQTIKGKDLKIYFLARNSSEHVITVYETSSTELASIIGYVLCENGTKADFSNIKYPIRKGFDFKSFNDTFDNVLEDMVAYPVYKSNMITIFRDYWQLFLKGLGVTILLAVIAIALSLILGACLCLLKINKNKVVSFIASAYIEIIRGVPSLLLLLLIYCVVGPTKIHIGSFFSTEVLSCILALFLNSSAYTAEIFRSGIQAVDNGQMEAGRALGLSNWQVLKKVVLPQGVKNALPSLGNELVMIIKETSLAYSINNAIGELMSAKVTVTSVTGNALAPYIIIAIIYFIVTFSLSRLIMYLEKRFA